MSDAKLVQVGRDGISYNTLPGSSAEISIESSSLDNSIFGQAYQSSLAGVFSYSLSANAWLRQTPGFYAEIKSATSSTAFATPEATTLVSGKTYRITDPDKRILDPAQEVTVFDDGFAVASSNVVLINNLFGEITLADDYVVTGPITVDGSFLTTTALGCANSASLTQSTDVIDTSCFETVAANGGYVTNEAGTKTVSLELSGFYREANNFFDVLDDREELIVEIDWEGDGETISRGFFRVMNYSQDGDQGGNENYSVTLELSVPDDFEPFGWYFGTDSKAPAGFKDIIGAWLDRDYLYFRYYPRGVDNEGYEGRVIVSDASISTAVDAIGELSLDGTGDGNLEAIV